MQSEIQLTPTATGAPSGEGLITAIMKARSAIGALAESDLGSSIAKAGTDVGGFARVMGTVLSLRTEATADHSNTRRTAADAIRDEVAKITTPRGDATVDEQNAVAAAIDAALVIATEAAFEAGITAAQLHIASEIRPVEPQCAATAVTLTQKADEVTKLLECLTVLETALTTEVAASSHQSLLRLEAETQYSHRHEWYLQAYSSIQGQQQSIDKMRGRMEAKRGEQYQAGAANPHAEGTVDHRLWEQQKNDWYDRNTRDLTHMQDFINKTNTDVTARREDVKRKFQVQVNNQSHQPVVFKEEHFQEKNLDGPPEISNNIARLLRSIQGAFLVQMLHNKKMQVFVDGNHFMIGSLTGGIEALCTITTTSSDGSKTSLLLAPMHEDLTNQSKTVYDVISEALPVNIRTKLKPGMVYIPKSGSDSEMIPVLLKEGDGLTLIDIIYSLYVQKDVYFQTYILGML